MVELTPTARQIALAHVVIDIEKAASVVGWDHAPSLYALVHTAMLLEQPDLPDELKDALRKEWDGTDEHLSAIIQEDFQGDDLEEMLAHLAWPPSVVGAALSVERVIVPPEVEAQAPADPEEAIAFIPKLLMSVSPREHYAVAKRGVPFAPALSIATTRLAKDHAWFPA